MTLRKQIQAAGFRTQRQFARYIGISEPALSSLVRSRSEAPLVIRRVLEAHKALFEGDQFETNRRKSPRWKWQQTGFRSRREKGWA